MNNLILPFVQLFFALFQKKFIIPRQTIFPFGHLLQIPVNIVKLVILVEGDLKVPFSISTTPRCRGVLSIPWIAAIYPWFLTLYCWVLSKSASSTIFEFLVLLDLGLNPGLPNHWRTLISFDQWLGCFIDNGHVTKVQWTIWFSFVSFFDGISTFVGYLMPKQSF